MRVHLYTISLNEAGMLPFFFRHYDSWVDRYFVYDDGSTDATRELLQAHPKVELRQFQRVNPESFVDSHRQMQDSVWKESRGRADWVVITAIDEHLHHPCMAMSHYLDLCAAKGVTCLPALGYNMVSEDFPGTDEVLTRTRRQGAPDIYMSKLSIFDPHAVEETHFHHGRHAAQPSGRIYYPDQDELLLLHYKLLGRQRTLERHRFLHGGLRDADHRAGWGHHYSWSEEQFSEYWNDQAKNIVTVFDDDGRMHGVHPEMRWWRGKGLGVKS